MKIEEGKWNPKEEFADSPFLWKVWNATHNGKMNQIILVTGLPRTGKSELCQWLAWKLDRDENGRHLYSVAEQTAWDAVAYAKLIKKYAKFKGKPLVWEEAGVAGKGVNARKWQDEANIKFNNIFQIMGKHRQIAIINLPAQFILDKVVRSLAHWRIFTDHVDVVHGVCVCRIRQIVSIQEKDSVRYVKLTYFDENLGRVVKEKGSEIPRPPLSIRNAYNALEEAHKPIWIDEAIADIEKARENEGKDARIGVKVNLAEEYESIVDNPDLYWDDVKNKPDVNAIMIKGNLSKDKAYAISGVWKKEVKMGLRNV